MCIRKFVSNLLTLIFRRMSIPDTKAKHIGKKIERIREIKGMKQETLASMIGVSQQTISRIEQSEEIDDEKLKQIADALEVPVDAIKGFNEEAAVNIIANNYNGTDNSSAVNFQCHFNPIDKLIELVDENRKLYERLLKEKDDIIEMYKTKQKAS